MRQRPARRKARIPPALTMDYDQTIIPGHIYQSWLQDASDIVSKRGRKQGVVVCEYFINFLIFTL